MTRQFAAWLIQPVMVDALIYIAVFAGGAVVGGLLVFAAICVLFADEAPKGPWHDGGVRADTQG